MTHTPHDALFKAAFETPSDAAGMFRGVLPSALVGAIAWDTIANERGSFVAPELAHLHSDLLFSARLGGRRVLLYLLLEHQSTNDPDMPLRILVYLARIWERFRKDPEHADAPLPAVIPVVVSHAPAGWTAPRTFHELFDPLPSTIPGLGDVTPSFALLVEDLARMSNDEIKGLALDSFPALALWALRDARDPDRLLRNLEHWADAFIATMRSRRGIEGLRQIMRYISLVAPELDQDAFRAKIREQIPEAEDATMTLAEQWMNEGREQGQRDMLRKQLALKFGSLPADVDARMGSATLEDLDRYAARVLVAETLDAVFE